MEYGCCFEICLVTLYSSGVSLGGLDQMLPTQRPKFLVYYHTAKLLLGMGENSEDKKPS